MILVSGRSVVSVLNGLPSTRPLSTTEWRSLIGKSGFVTLVGSENGGAVRSTRSLSGATGSFSNPAAASWAAVGWGIAVDLDSAAVEAEELAAVLEVPGFLSLPAVVSAPQAPTTARAANSVSAATPLVKGLLRFASIVPP